MAECSSCPSSEGCSKDKDSCMIENNSLNNVKKIIGVMSGKGWVGKFYISVLIGKHLKQIGYSVGLLDADIFITELDKGIISRAEMEIGSDAVLVVTEPTKSGLEDLMRVVTLCEHFGVFTMVCINKYDINEEVAK